MGERHRLTAGDAALTVPMPSMAKRTVAKNSGRRATGAIHGRDRMSGSGTSTFPSSGLMPVISHVNVQTKPKNIKVMAMAENGINSRNVRTMPSGTSGTARPNTQTRNG